MGEGGRVCTVKVSVKGGDMLLGQEWVLFCVSRSDHVLSELLKRGMWVLV